VLAQLAGRAVNAVTPTGNLGEAIKISVLTEHVSQARALATILLYNVVSFSVELGIVAVAAPIIAIFVPKLRVMMLVASAVCAVLSVGIYLLVRFGVLGGVGRLLRRLRIISAARHATLGPKLTSIDDMMKYTAGARRRDRWLGIVLVSVSRLTSMMLSLMILYAIGETITLRFVAGYTVGGFMVYMLASFVPMGLGVSEGGYYKLFQALGENPARGTTLVLARRVTLIMYAGIGIVLTTASETVKRARAKHLVPAPAKIPEAVAVINPAPAPATE
jgi:hypothetical protein